ncbi:3-hydroxyisobutyrate dehydrogenase [Tamaricihabitans halophyticus]|uniref:3-hydroxyisobutyrate dehydrogenase n=1 Tax=Tamaricihabitans halophyticus TaxID=1262583 RepID=A0A4R2R413_9PSEU|nr:NAD(P)-dependent oxidoreductase [Tamaricihabitans halophyticus]TCP56398.1 3-hydroxyisobutyrate dehydrogenase [Tamaricihabitans halophyticus]
MVRIGIIGLGNMGGRIASRISAAGHQITGYDQDPERVSAAGARVADSITELVENTDYILLSLPDSTVVEAVVAGEGGILESCRPEQVIVDLSTAAPGSTLELHGRLAERGAELVDAGVSGGAAAAEKGTLAVMVGGDTEVVERIRWVFEPFATKVVHMGGPSAGHTTKLLNNFLNAVSLSATAEVMVAGRKAGLDLEALLEVLNNGSGVNFATLNRFPHIVRGDYLEGGLTGALMTKDIALYVDRIRELGVPCLNAAGPLASFGLANQLGYVDQISNRVVDAIGDVAGGVRLHDDGEKGAAQ